MSARGTQSGAAHRHPLTPSLTFGAQTRISLPDVRGDVNVRSARCRPRLEGKGHIVGTMPRGQVELLERREDRGGVEVWSARHSSTRAGGAALEVLRFPLSEPDPRRQAEAEFRRRLEVLSAWEENTLIDVVQKRDALLIVARPLDGHDLPSLWRLSAEGGVGLPLQVAARVLRDAARALSRLQAAVGAQVHAELLPSSVVLGPDGHGHLRDVAVPWTALAPGEVRRWRYRSPEEARGEKPGPASDQFTLGVLLFEACAGRRLFLGRDVEEVRRQLCGPPAPALGALVPGFPADLDQLVARLLARDPADRFESFGHVASALEEYLHRTTASLGDIPPQAFLQAVAQRRTGSASHPRRRSGPGRPPPVPHGAAEESGPLPPALPPPAGLRPPPFRRPQGDERADPAWGWLLAGGSLVFSVALAVRELVLPAPSVASAPPTAPDPSAELAAQSAVFEGLLDALRADDPSSLESLKAAMTSPSPPKLGEARARYAARLSLIESAVARQATQAALWFSVAGETDHADDSLARAEAARLDAYILAGEARTFGSHLPEATLAMVAYLAERGAHAELETELDVFRSSLLRPEIPEPLRSKLHAEAIVQRRLSQISVAMERDGAPPLEVPHRVVVDDNRVRWSELAWVSRREGGAPSAPTSLLGAPAGHDPRVEASWLAAHRRALAEVTVPDGAAGALPTSPALHERIAAARAEGSADELIAVASQALERGDCHWAAVGFREALQLDQNSLRAWQGIGWAAIDLGNNEEAVRSFRNAVALPGASHEARFGLAEAYRFAGELEQAVAAYEEFLSRAPEGPDATVARNALVQLRD